MLGYFSFYDLVFYFGILILSSAVVILAWKSTYVRGQQNLTLVVWQRASVQRTVQRIIAERSMMSNNSGTHGNSETVSGSNNASGETDSENSVTVEDLDAASIESVEDIGENLDLQSELDDLVISGSSSQVPTTTVASSVLEQSSSIQPVATSESVASSERQIDMHSEDMPCEEMSVRSKSDHKREEVSLDEKEDASPSPTGASSVTICRESASLSSLEKNNEASTNSTGVPSSSSSSDQNTKTCHKDSIRIRLKFLDENQKTVLGQPTEKVLSFKRNHFNRELSQHRVVRLIFNGKLLHPDDSTLAQCGLFDNCVVHCHVSQPKPPPTPPPNQPAEASSTSSAPTSLLRRLTNFMRFSTASTTTNNNNANDDNDINGISEGLDISNCVFVLLWIIVLSLWFVRFRHSYLFSTFSTFMLISLTMLLVVPQYIFSVDVQFSVNLDVPTLRNLGIERVLLVRAGTGGATGQHNSGATSDQGTSPEEDNSTSTSTETINASDASTTTINSGQPSSTANLQNLAANLQNTGNQSFNLVSTDQSSAQEPSSSSYKRDTCLNPEPVIAKATAADSYSVTDIKGSSVDDFSTVTETNSDDSFQVNSTGDSLESSSSLRRRNI